MFLVKRNWPVQLFCFFLFHLTACLLIYIFRTRTFRSNSLWDRMYTPITCFLFSVHIFLTFSFLSKTRYSQLWFTGDQLITITGFFWVLFCFSLAKTIYRTIRSLCAKKKKIRFLHRLHKEILFWSLIPINKLWSAFNKKFSLMF